MADPLSKQIIDNLITTIGAIEAGTTYNRTVRVCQRLTYMAQELSQFDAVFVYDNGCTKSLEKSLMVNECRMSVMLDCWVKDDSVAEAIDHLAADIEKAIKVDINRGGVARDTNVVAVRKFISQDQQPEGNCEIDIVIEYRHQEGDPYTAM